MKKLFMFQLRKLLVPFIILSLLLVINASLNIFITPLYVRNDGGPFMRTFFDIGTVLMTFIISAVAAIIAMSYKYGMIREDFYQQLPFKPKNLRRYMYISGLIVSTLATIIGFALCLMLYGIKYSIDLNTVNNSGGELIMAPFNWGYLILGMLVLVGYSICNYCLCATILDQNIGIFESMINILLMQVVLALIIQMPYAMINKINENGYGSIGFGGFNIYMFIQRFDILSFYSGGKVTTRATDIISMVGIFALGVGSFLWSFFRKDVSAEKENTKGSPCILPIVTLHATFPAVVMSASLISFKMPSLIVWPIILYIVTAIAIFFLHVLYNHGFKLKKMQWIPAITVAAISFVFIPLMAFIR